MKYFGELLIGFGILSAGLHFLGYEPVFGVYGIDREFAPLSWIDNWGETVGWSIRGAMVFLGIGFFFAGIVQAKTASY